MSKAEVILNPLNLPPIVDTEKTYCTVADVNKECSISLSTQSTASLHNEEDKEMNYYEDDNKQSTINVVNSNDVIIGSVTQFHGPVTILQHAQTQSSQESIEEKSEKDSYFNTSKLVTTDYAPSSSKDLPACISKKFLISFTSLTIVISLTALIVIFSTGRKQNQRNEDIADYTDFSDNTTLSSTISPTTVPLITTSPKTVTVTTPDVDNKYYISGHEFYRVSDWRGRPPLWETPITQPISYIIVSHTAGINCQSFIECSAQLQIIQGLHVTAGEPQIGYNFLIGGDGNVYEARGWFARNYHRDSSLGISFMGNFVFDEPTDFMIDAFEKLLELGLRLKILPISYRIVGHNQTTPTLSPGQNIFRVIKNHPKFYPDMVPSARVLP